MFAELPETFVYKVVLFSIAKERGKHVLFFYFFNLLADCLLLLSFLSMMNDNPGVTPYSSSVISRTVFHEDDFTHPCHPLYVHLPDVLGTSLVFSPFDGSCYGISRRNICSLHS